MPHFVRSESTLSSSTSVFFHVSCDTPDTWQNGIFHNSRYGIFHLKNEGGKLKIELTSKGLNTNKFRKATVKSEDQAVEKIKAWMNAIIGWCILPARYIIKYRATYILQRSILTAHMKTATTQQTNSELHKEFAAYIERDAVYNKRTHKGQRNAQRRAKQAQRVRYMDSY